jgi:hypothetical protein
MVGQEEINEIQAEILKEASGRIAKDLGRSLSIISEMVFVRTARFIMELIQNAEDALIDADYPGEMEITVSNKRIKIIHNGKPFTREDVDAICGVRSTKKPERGTLGYLGIGFKSVFKITDCPQIFSGSYAFKFDKNHWKEEHYRALWPIIPIPISLENITETIPLNKTTFILPFRSKEGYDIVKDELKRLGPHLFMFLKKLSKLIIIDEVTGEKKIFEWYLRQQEKLSPTIEVKNIKVIENGKARSFIVFSGIFNVPDNVRADKLTQDAQRGGVVAREVSIAFPLDEKEERLVEIKEIGWVYGGLYSFLPLEEAISGARFLIQGDFIVQPGREAINYEAEWNKWMFECVGEVASQAIEFFWRNPKFCGQYIPFFEIESKEYSDFYFKLIEPKLKRKLKEKLKDPYVPAVDGTIIPLSKAVKITEEVESFIQKSLLKKDDLSIIFKKEGLNFIGKDVKTGSLNVEELTLAKLHNKELIEKKLKEDVGIDFLVELYNEVYKKNYGFSDGWVIDKELKIRSARDTYFSSLPKEIEELLEEVPEIKETLGEYIFVHPKLEAMIGYLLRKAGVKSIRYEEICEKVVIPRVSIRSPKPTSDDAKKKLKVWTYMLKKGKIYPNDEIWVLDRSGEARSSSELFLPIGDKDKIEKYEKTGIKFVDLDAYMSVDREQDKEKARQEWINFFNGMKIKSPKEDKKSVDVVLKKIGKDAPKLSKEDLLICTKVLKELCEIFPDKELQPIQVLTDKEEIEISENVYFSSKYEPEQDWQRQNLVEVGRFLSDKYLEEGDIKGWKEFFRKVKVREKAPSEAVEKYAIAFVNNKLHEQGYSNIKPSQDGHDLVCSKDGIEYYIEVKGRTGDVEDIKLEKSEVKAAIKKKNTYILMIVFGVPNQPKLCKITNPIEAIEDWYEITIPKETLKKFYAT